MKESHSTLGLLRFALAACVVAFEATVVACAPSQAAATPTPPSAPAKPTASINNPTSETAKPAAAPTQAPVESVTSSAPIAVRVGSQSAVSDGGLFVAMEKGYFKEVGLDVQFSAFASAGTDMVASLATDQLDVGGIGVNSALYGAAARGVNIKIVADKGSMTPGHGYQPFVVRKSLMDSGAIKSEADLKGKKIALVAPADGNAAFIMLEKVLAKGNLTLKDVDYVLMPFANMPAAFANGAVDAGTVIEPTASAIVENGDGKIWADSYQIYPGLQLGVLAYGPSFVERSPQAARDFMVAYMRGARDYILASDKGVGKADVVAALIKYTNVKNAAVYDKMIWAGLNPNGYVNASGLADDQDFYFRQGTIQTKVELSKLIDNQYVDYALQKLGKYQQ